MKCFKMHIPAMIYIIGFCLCASAQPNVLTNGDFESTSATNMGNNIGQSIAPWVVGSGNQPNVVRVDGSGGFNYGSNGPESDASNSPAGTIRHYLDITNGSNNFYQSFTPECSGSVTFGGYFSTRANSAGSASLQIRKGDGVSGQLVSQTNEINLPGGQSKSDQWTLLQQTVTITAGETYSYVVSMNNNMNFDEGFVTYNFECEPIETDPCCPPWTNAHMEKFLSYNGSGGISDPYTLKFSPSSTFMNQIQAYIDYVHAISSSMHTINFTFRLFDAGMGASPATSVSQVGNSHFVSWSAGSGGTPNSPINLFNINSETMHVNKWYLVQVGVWLNNGLEYFPRECSSTSVYVRIQTLLPSQLDLDDKARQALNLEFQRTDGERVFRDIEIQDRNKVKIR